jgi:hypothetical protein
MASEAELRALYTAAGQARAFAQPRTTRFHAHALPPASRAPQGHVFAFWSECDDAERAALLEQLRQVDPHEINKARRKKRPAVLSRAYGYASDALRA